MYVGLNAEGRRLLGRVGYGVDDVAGLGQDDREGNVGMVRVGVLATTNQTLSNLVLILHLVLLWVSVETQFNA